MSETVQRNSLPVVLAIEDNPGDVRLIKEGVAAADPEIELRVQNNGSQAIEWLTDETQSRERLGLILLDLNLPGKSGFDVLQAVREGPQYRGMPVVVVSSSEDPADVRRVYERSANAYVTKPADPDEYVQMIVAAVRFWVSTADS